jgi:hypothetical protein
MKVNVSMTINNYDNTPVESLGKPYLTYRTAFAEALNNYLPEDRPDATQKLERFILTSKLYQAEEVELSRKESVLIEECVARIYSNPLILGRVHELFEAAESAKS